jgi:acyl dehydratase
MSESPSRSLVVIYLEDLELGSVGTFGDYRVTEEEIVEFGRRYNPLPYHVDADHAGPFGGLVATGWQSGAIMMRLATDNWIAMLATLEGTGIDARFRTPVRPGDRLRVQIDVLSIEASERSRDRGTVRWRGTLLNQNDESALVCDVTMRVSRHPSDD